MATTPRKEGPDIELSVCDFESVCASNKERRMIRFDSECKKSFDYEDSRIRKRSLTEEILPIGELTKSEQSSLAKAFEDLFCCSGQAE